MERYQKRAVAVRDWIFFRRMSWKGTKRERSQCEIGTRAGKFPKICPKASQRKARMDPEPENFIKYVQKPAVAGQEWIQSREIYQKMSKSRRQQGENGSRTGKLHKICPKAGGSRARMDPEQGNIPKYVQKPAVARREWIQNREISQKMSKSRRQQGENGSRAGKFHKICPKAGGSGARMDPEQGNFRKYVQKPAAAVREWIQNKEISQNMSKSRR